MSESRSPEAELFLSKLAQEMGNAGYCNYDACWEFLDRAYSAAERETRERIKEALCDTCKQKV